MSNLLHRLSREKVAEELKSGKLCVMVYLKTDIREKDEKRIDEIKEGYHLVHLSGR